MMWLSSRLQLYAEEGVSAGCSVCALTVCPYHISIPIYILDKHYGALCSSNKYSPCERSLLPCKHSTVVVLH